MDSFPGCREPYKVGFLFLFLIRDSQTFNQRNPPKITPAGKLHGNWLRSCSLYISLCDEK